MNNDSTKPKQKALNLNYKEYKIGTRVKCARETFGGFSGQSGEVVATDRKKTKVLMDSCKKSDDMDYSDKFWAAYWFWTDELQEIKDK